MISKEFWHINHRESEIREKELVTIDKCNLLIKSMYSFVSTGTEKIVANGLVPAELKDIMKVPFMEGRFDFPVKYGYSLVGKVIQGNPAWIGKTVHLMHPHQDYIVADETVLTIVPESIPAQRAVLASNMETAVNAIWDSGISIGNTVIICGFGIIGALIAIVARQIPGVNISIHETDINRRKLAASLGFEIYDTETPGFIAFDIAFNTSASGEALQLCIDTTLPQSKIIEVSWYGLTPVNIRLGGSFHVGQKQIIASQVSTIPLKKQSHFSYKRRKQLVFELLQNNIFDQLPFQFVEFENLPEVFNQLRNNKYKEFATIVNYK